MVSIHPVEQKEIHSLEILSGYVIIPTLQSKTPYGLWAQVEIPILRSEFSCSCAVNTRIIITYYGQTASVILNSTKNKTNNFEMIMKSLYGLCNSKLQQIYAFIYYDFPGHPLLVNYSNAIDQEKSIKSRNCL